MRVSAFDGCGQFPMGNAQILLILILGNSNKQMLDRRQKTRRRNKENLEGESEKKYYVEILRGIESIQSTILSKLDRKVAEKMGADHQTPKRGKETSRQKSSNKTNRTSRSYTASKEYQTHCFTNRTVAYQNRLAQSHFEHSPQILKPTQRQPRTEQRERKQFSRQAHYNSECTSRWQNQIVPTISIFQLENQPKKTANIMDSRLYSSRRREVNDRIKQRFKPQSIQPDYPQSQNNDIQKYYSKQIYKLQVQNFIDSLQKEFQTCLHTKRTATAKQQSTLRTRMKNISLQINLLKDCRKRLQATFTV